MPKHVPKSVAGSKSAGTEDGANSTSAVLLMVCVYIFLVIERPWESIRYLQGVPIERTFAAVMILVAVFSGKFRVMRSPTNKWVYGLVALHFVLAPFAFNWGFAVDQGIEYAKMVVLYLLMLAVVEDQRSLKLLVKAFVFSMMLYVIHSLWEYYNGRHVWRMGIARMIGVDSFMNDPNAFGASIVLSFPFAYALLRMETRKIVRMVYYGYFSLGLVCLVLTGSRSAFLGFVLLLLLWNFAQKGRKRIYVLVLGLSLIGAVWTFMPEDKQLRIQTLWDKDAGPASAHQSAEGRIVGWKVSWEMFKREPLTGVGAGGQNFIGYRIANHIDAQFDHEDVVPESQSHILYGQVLAELGILGAIFFCGLAVSIGRASIAVRRFRSARGAGREFVFVLSGAIIGSLLLLLFLGLGGHNFYRPLWLWLAAWSGGLLRIAKEEKEEAVCEV